MDHIVQKKDQAICQFNSKWGQCLCKCFTYQRESDNGKLPEAAPAPPPVRSVLPVSYCSDGSRATGWGQVSPGDGESSKS